VSLSGRPIFLFVKELFQLMHLSGLDLLHERDESERETPARLFSAAIHLAHGGAPG